MSTPLAAFEELVTSRRAVKSYDPDHEVDDATLAKLFELTALSPSSFNLQHWRFVVARTKETKEALSPVAYNQPQITAASAVVCVCGKLNAHEDVGAIFAEAPESVRKSMGKMIPGMYADNAQGQRDEAIRSGSLAAMTLMYAAKSMGLATGPMIGFDPVGVAGVLNLPDNLVPVMLIVLGKQTGDMRPRAFRWPVSDFVFHERHPN
jgi:putative NAD(P)H nitroreductase